MWSELAPLTRVADATSLEIEMGSRLIAASVLAFVACTSVHEPAGVVDTSGARFRWACNADGQCDPAAEAGTPALSTCFSSTPMYGASLDRFVIISAVCDAPGGGWSSNGGPNLDRPLACTSDSDCPQFGGWAFECRNMLCQNRNTTTYPLTSIDGGSAYELCFAPFARGDTIDPMSPISQQVTQEVTAWVAAACPSGSPCTTLPLPSMCLEP